jgi:hypothetical protein
MRKLLRPFLILLAVIFLIEAWLWDRLEPIVAAVVRLIPFEKVKARIAASIDGLPPSGTGAVFLIPVAFALPFKVFGFWLLAKGNWSAAVSVFIAAKFLTLAITAFVFDVARDKLLQLDWFRMLYEYVLLLRAAAETLIDPVRRRIERRMRLLMPGRSRRAFRLLKRIRRWMHQPVPAE